MTPGLTMKLLLLPFGILISAVAVSCNYGTQYRQPSVIVHQEPVYQPEIVKTHTFTREHEKHVKVPVVETHVPVTTSHVREVSYEKAPLVKTEHTSIVVPVQTGEKSIEQQYVPVQRRVPLQTGSHTTKGGPVETNVEVKTTYRVPHAPVHTGYRSKIVDYGPAHTGVRSAEVPVGSSYKSADAPVHTSYRSVHVPVQTSYRSYAPVQTSYRSIHTPIQASYRSIHTPIQTSYRSIQTPVHTSYRSVQTYPVQTSYRSVQSYPVQTSYKSQPVQTSYRSIHTPIQTSYRSIQAPSYRSVYVPVQAGQKSIHAAGSNHYPSIVGWRYSGY